MHLVVDQQENLPNKYTRDVPGEQARYYRGAKGFDAVFVNGALVLENDEYVDVAAGCGMVV